MTERSRGRGVVATINWIAVLAIAHLVFIAMFFYAAAPLGTTVSLAAAGMGIAVGFVHAYIVAGWAAETRRLSVRSAAIMFGWFPIAGPVTTTSLYITLRVLPIDENV